MNQILTNSNRKQSKKKYFLISILLVFLIICSFFALYKHLLLEKIISFLQYKLKYLENYDISIQKVKGGILTDFVIYNVAVKKSKEKQDMYEILNISKFKINLSFKKIFFSFFSDKSISDIKISLKTPVFHLTDNFLSDFVYPTNKFLLDIKTFLEKSSLNLIEIDQTKIKISDCYLTDISFKEPILNNLDSEILIDSKNNIFFNKTEFNLFKFPLKLKGRLNLKYENLDLKVVSNSNMPKFNISLSGKFDYCKITSNVKLFKKANYDIDGILSLKKSGIFFKDIYMKSDIGNDINKKKKSSADGYDFLYEFLNKESNIYIINGAYNYIDKKANFEIKGGLKQSKKYKKLYYDEYNFNQLFALECNLFDFPKVKAELKIKRLMLENLNYISNFYFQGNFKLDNSYVLNGNLYSQGSILNYQPFYEFTGKLRLTEGKLEIKNFKLKDITDLNFSIKSEEQYKINLTLNTEWIDIDSFLHQFYPEIIPEIKGDVALKLNMNGKLLNPDISGNAVIKNGIIKESVFKIAEVRFKGDKKWVKFYKSRLFQKNSFYSIRGGVNLFKINQSDFLSQVKIIPMNQAFTWEGWTFSSIKEGEEIQLEKELGEDFKVGFSTYLDKKIGNKNKTSNDKNGLELEYSLTEDKSLKLEFKEDEEIVGVQKSIEF